MSKYPSAIKVVVIGVGILMPGDDATDPGEAIKN